MSKEKLEEILLYVEPVKIDLFSGNYLPDPASVYNSLIINSESKQISSTEKFELAIIFIDPEIKDNEQLPSVTIREELYKLKKISSSLRIADLGNLKKGNNQTETFFALHEVCSLLFQLKVNLLLIGGPQSNTIPVFRAMKDIENDINLVHIDSRIDLSISDNKHIDTQYLSEIIEKETAHLYNISCVGHQSYFVDQKQINLLNENYFEHYRLGQVRNNFEEIEPVIRDADIVSFDLSAIKSADAPAAINNSPNGFLSDEACKLTRYAGISDRVKALGIFEYDPHSTDNSQTAKLIAQMIWYYWEGFIYRKHDYPVASLENYIKYIVDIDEIEIPIVFYKSNKTQRWWIEVNNHPENVHDHVNVIASCSETDYLKACNNEIPDRWWINFKKLR
jgi:formiminoglutamase